MIAEESPSEANHWRILLSEPGDITVELHDVDDGLLESGTERRRLVPRPLVLLIELSRCDER